MDRDDLYTTKINEGSDLLGTGIYRADFDTDEEFRIAGLKKLIKARDLFNDAFDISTTQDDRDSLRPLLDATENLIIDLQLARTT